MSKVNYDPPIKMPEDILEGICAIAFTHDGEEYDSCYNWETAQTMSNGGYYVVAVANDGNMEKDEIQKDRLATALKYAAEWGHVVVLKGAFTVVAAPDGRATVVPVAHPALARAGSGDVLAGLIVGLRAQGLDAYEAAIAGAWIHAQAGLLAADRVGAAGSVLAGDILDSIPDALSGF